MASNRAALIGKLHTALKKHYEPVPAGNRPLLEHILYASLLEGVPYDRADEGLAKMEQSFFDWNEIRVTTVTELSQVLGKHPDAHKAAARMKGNLQGVFEEYYTFELDHLRKENLGKAVAKFEKMSHMTPFVLAYTVQNGLGGHQIPVDYPAMVIMLATGIVNQTEANSGKVPGLERAIPKTKGQEFGSLLHQCAVALNDDPKDATARKVLDAVAKGSSKNLDEWLASRDAAKKRVKKRKAAERAARKAEAADEDVADKPAAKKSAKKKATPKKSEPAPAAAEAAKPKAAAKKTAAPKTAPPKTDASKPAAKKATSKKTAAKKPAAKKAAAKKTPVKKAATKKTAAKKAPVKKKTKKKPR